MKTVFKHIYILVTLTPLFFNAEVDPKLFLEKFHRASIKNKVHLVASVSFEEIKDIYPQIEDTLAMAKKIVLVNSKDKATQFACNKIEADRALYKQNYTQAIVILENSLRKYTSNIQDSLVCFALLKNAFVKIRDINKAFEMNYFLESKWQQKSDTVHIDYGQQKSTLYNMIGLTNEAIKERRKEAKKNLTKDDIDGYANFYNDIGVFFNTQKKSDSAEFYFLKAKKLLLKKNGKEDNKDFYNFFLALIDGNLALSYYNRGAIVEATPLLKTDVYYSLKVQNYESAFNSLTLLTKCYIHLKQKQIAQRYLDSALVLLDDKVKGIAPKLRFYLTSADYYNFTNNFGKSNECYKKYLAINDSFQQLEKERHIKNQGVSISIEQTEIALNEKDRLLELNKLEEAKQKSYRAYLVASIFILLTIIAFLILNNFNSKKRQEQLYNKNKQISAQNLLIEQSLKDKEALIKEIHHRVKNNLQIISSMLNLQIGKTENNDVETILKDAQQRVNAISLTHQMLYQKDNISTISLGDYVENLVKQIERTVFSKNIQLIININSHDRKINIDTAIPLGLMINEILTNAYKHAFSENEIGKVTVSLIDIANECVLKITDDGKGLPEDFANTSHTSMGIELIHILSEQLGANLKIESKEGTRFIIEMKF